jgi:hypothetical protein
MRFEDQPASGTDPGAVDPGTRPRRRTPRSWSVPAGGDRFDRPAQDDWASSATPTAPPPRPRRVGEPQPPPPPPGADLGPLTGLLGDLRGELSQLRTALEASAGARDESLVTGEELAATIESLGTTLGSGIASLLTEHRSLLARDVEGAAVRILEEINQRFRASGALIVDGVEERVRHVNVKSLGDVVDQLDLRLDQIQADVAGLRAVMLEIPDQTAVAERLDQLSESLGGTRRDTNRLTPALSAAIERSVQNALERVRPASDVESEGGGLDADALEAFTTEMQALRRRISIRTDARGEAVELSGRQLDDLADRVAARMRGERSPSRSDDEDGDDGPDPDVPVPRRSRRKR